MLNICCLCPTYGRPTLVRNTIAMFLAQHYDLDHARLLILDDGDQITGESDTWKVVTVRERFPSYCYKYGVLARLAMDAFDGWRPDAFALFEDDDIYGPFYLLEHDQILQKHHWSYPSRILSLYGKDTNKGELPFEEPTDGRFWSSSAITVEYLRERGGFNTSCRADTDQVNIRNWSSGAIPGRPNEINGIQWIYGWGRAQHCSGFMTDGPTDTTWYLRHKKTEHLRIDGITPHMDDQAKFLYEQLWCKECMATDCIVRSR